MRAVGCILRDRDSQVRVVGCILRDRDSQVRAVGCILRDRDSQVRAAVKASCVVLTGSGTSLAPGTQVDSVGDGQAVSTAASKYVFNSKADDDASTKSSSEHMTVLSDTTEHLTPCNDVIIVAAAHGDTSIDGSASSGSSKRNESPVVAPTAIVIPPTAHVPTAATDLKANGVVLHQNEMTDLESDGDAVDSCHIKQNGVLPFSPHPPISPKPERRVSPRDKRDAVTVSHQQPDAIVTNGDLKKMTENVESLTPDDKCVNHEVEHVCDANGEVAPLELTNTSRTAPVTTEEEMACKVGTNLKIITCIVSVLLCVCVCMCAYVHACMCAYL